MSAVISARLKPGEAPPVSARGASEAAVANELVHVIHAWLADVDASIIEEVRRGSTSLR